MNYVTPEMSPISRGFSAEDLNGVRLPGSADALADIGVETQSGIVCNLEFSFNIGQKRFGFVLRLDSTEPRNSSRLFHSMRLTVLRKFCNFSLLWLQGDSFSFYFIDSFLLDRIKYGTRHPRYGISSFEPLGLYIVRDRYKKRVFPLMPASIHIVIGYDQKEVNC